MIEILLRGLAILAAVVLIMELIIIVSPKRFPRLPGDIDIYKGGIRIYIPFTSAIVISVLISIFFSFVRK